MAYSQEEIDQIEKEWRLGSSFRELNKKHKISVATLSKWKKNIWDKKSKRVLEIKTEIESKIDQKYIEKKADDVASEKVRVEAEYRKIFEDLRKALQETVEVAKFIKIIDSKDLSQAARGLKALIETAVDLKAEEMAELEANTETQAVLHEQFIYLPGSDEPIDPSMFNSIEEIEAALTEQDPHAFYATPDLN